MSIVTLQLISHLEYQIDCLLRADKSLKHNGINRDDDISG